MEVIIIKGENIRDIYSFYEEVNNVFMYNESWRIGESLDALDDILYGGIGVVKAGEPLLLIWENAAISKQFLGLEMTKEYYQHKIKQGAPYNIKLAKEKLSELEAGAGSTYFEIIQEIIAGHKQITLVLK